jgi:hypothetical protein
MPDNPNKAYFYDVKWQIFRVNLLSDSNSWGGWNNPAKNIELLKEYVSNHKDITNVYRALNLLAGVRLGFAQRGMKECSADFEVREYLWILENLYYTLRNENHKLAVPTESQIKADLKSSHVMDLFAVQVNLTNRLNAHKESTHRGGLRWFLSLLNAHLIEISNENNVRRTA